MEFVIVLIAFHTVVIIDLTKLIRLVIDVFIKSHTVEITVLIPFHTVLVMDLIEFHTFDIVSLIPFHTSEHFALIVSQFLYNVIPIAINEAITATTISIGVDIPAITAPNPVKSPINGCNVNIKVPIVEPTNNNIAATAAIVAMVDCMPDGRLLNQLAKPLSASKTTSMAGFKLS